MAADLTSQKIPLIFFPGGYGERAGPGVVEGLG